MIDDTDFSLLLVDVRGGKVGGTAPWREGSIYEARCQHEAGSMVFMHFRCALIWCHGSMRPGVARLSVAMIDDRSPQSLVRKTYSK